VLNQIYFGNVLARITVAFFCCNAHDAKHIEMISLKYCQIEVFCFFACSPGIKLFFF